MSTFPRGIKLKQSSVIGATGTPAEPLLTLGTARPTSDSNFTGTVTNFEFDAGLNSSAAWTEHLGHDFVVVKESETLSISEDGDPDVVGSGRNTIKGFKRKQKSAGNSMARGNANTDGGPGLEDNVNDKDADTNQQDSEETSYGPGRPARVLYDFSGERALRELCLRAGDEVEILRETIDGAEGWSLARPPRPRRVDGRGRDEDDHGEVGLVPREYYTFTTDFLSSPGNKVQLLPESYSKDADNNTDETRTPRASTCAIASAATPKRPPLVPQNTGEWFRQQMRSVLGGRSLNRFSRFVTSGAEAYILHGAPPSSRNAASLSPGPKGTHERERDFETKDAEVATGKGTDGLPHLLAHSNRLSAYLTPSSTPISSSVLTHHMREPTVLPPETSPDTHYIDVGDAGPTWRTKVPMFGVRVHSPEKRNPSGQSMTGAGGGSAEGGAAESGAYIVYSITSTFDSPPSSDSSDNDIPQLHPHTLTVHRRFSHFVLLHQTLFSLLPGLALPPLPEKQFSGRLNAEFVEDRRGALQRYLRMLVRHPVVRYSEPVRFFLGCEDEVEWRRQLPTQFHLPRSRPPSTQSGPDFYASVYHPPFQIDLDPTDSDILDTSQRFPNHLQGVSRSVEHARGMFKMVRQARIEMSAAERMLGFEILGMISGRDWDSSSGFDDEEEEDVEGGISPRKRHGRGRGSYEQKKGLQNAEGAWCWREDCADCLRLTKCMQKTAETLQGVADLYDYHARRTMLETEDSLKDVAHPDLIYAPVLDIHEETLERYKEASSQASTSKNKKRRSGDINDTNDSVNSVNRKKKSESETQPESESKNEDKSEDKDEDEDSVTTRCETVLNTTLAEFDAYHAAKRDDFERIVKSHLDGEIAFYEKVLARLQKARDLYDTSPTELGLLMPGARQPSIYERNLPHYSLHSPSSSTHLIGNSYSEPLQTPAPHVLDNRGRPSMRPVSDAIQGLLGIGAGGVGDGKEGGRGEAGGSVFSRLW